MTNLRRFCLTIPLLLLLPIIPARAQSGQSLPNAPATPTPVPAPEAGPPPVHSSFEGTYRSSKWYGVVDPGEKVPPLNGKDKMMFWLHESISPVGWFPVVFSAGWEQLTNGDPKYGSDSPAFGERVGAGVLRVSSFRFFSDSLLPTLTHEDPRYFRKAYGSVMHRGVYSAMQTLVTKKDNGTTGVNYSSILGHLFGSALTATYYPEPSVNARVIFETYGVSMAGDAGGNLFLEFWPDVRDAIFHRHRKGPISYSH
jgi:hypothetical protein